MPRPRKSTCASSTYFTAGVASQAIYDTQSDRAPRLTRGSSEIGAAGVARPRPEGDAGRSGEGLGGRSEHREPVGERGDGAERPDGARVAGRGAGGIGRVAHQRGP